MSFVKYRNAFLVSCVALAAALSSLWAACRKSSVPLHLELEAERPFVLQVFFDEGGSGAFIEAHSLKLKVSSGRNAIDCDLPAEKVSMLRLDIGSDPGRVVLEEGTIGQCPFPAWKEWTCNSDIESSRSLDSAPNARVELVSHKIDPFIYVRLPTACRGGVRYEMVALPYVVVFGLAFLCILFIAFSPDGCVVCRLVKVTVGGLSPLEWLLVLACGLFYFAWSLAPFNYGPDEAMRFEVTRFLFENGRLPVGAETINAYWGFSYAHLPTMLCNVLGGAFMWVASLFTHDDRTLLIAARMVSVLSGAGAVYWVIRASRHLFHSPARWLLIVMIGALPQFAFVSSYVNNDSLALLGASMIFYVWVSSLHEGWSVGRTMILSLGMAICMMAYYNSYSWILLSMVVFPYAYFMNNRRDCAGFLRTGFVIAGVTLVVGGYLFARHVHLYGDLLGFETAHRFAAQYAQGIPGGVHETMQSEGVTLWQMLFEKQWLLISCRSFVGAFGYMAFWMPNWCYDAYAAVGIAGLGGMLCHLVESMWHRRRTSIGKVVLVLGMCCIVVITIALSVYYSYSRDYQPQGRYCFPALIPLACFVAKGLDACLAKIMWRKGQVILTVVLISVLLAVSTCGYSVLKETI